MDIPQPPTDLADTEWDIASLADEAGVLQPVVDGPRAAVIRFGPDGSVSGTTGCNNFMGTCTVGAGDVTFGPIASTMMMCPDALMVQERRVFAALEGTARWRVDDTQLSLLAAHGASLLVATLATPAD